MKTRSNIPRVSRVEVPRPRVLRVTFDDGLIRELEFIANGNRGTVFEALEDPVFFKQVRVDEASGTVAWPNGVDLDSSVLHGDFPPSGKSHFREVSKKTTKQLG